MNLSAFLGGSFGIIYAILGFLLAVLWLLFPFIVYAKFDRLIEEAERQTDLLRRIERGDHPDDRPIASEHSQSWKKTLRG
jgi:predicted membrane protein